MESLKHRDMHLFKEISNLETKVVKVPKFLLPSCSSLHVSLWQKPLRRRTLPYSWCKELCSLGNGAKLTAKTVVVLLLHVLFCGIPAYRSVFDVLAHL